MSGRVQRLREILPLPSKDMTPTELQLLSVLDIFAIRFEEFHERKLNDVEGDVRKLAEDYKSVVAEVAAIVEPVLELQEELKTHPPCAAIGSAQIDIENLQKDGFWKQFKAFFMANKLFSTGLFLVFVVIWQTLEKIAFSLLNAILSKTLGIDLAKTLGDLL
jgi:hypothetical protein